MTDHGLGRRHAPDPRDAAFPMRAALPVAPSTRTYRYWSANGWWGDQGQTSECVAYAWTHALEDGPFSQSGPAPCVNPDWLYHAAQEVDEWPGTDYDGTSGRAGAKVLQTLGFIAEYRWAESLDDVVQAILEVGPVVIGTDWYTGMFDPDSSGVVHPTGQVEGGHETKIDGANTKTRLFRVKNSWGRSWGRNGHFYLHFDDFAMLLMSRGEACIYIESSPADKAAALALVPKGAIR